MLVIVLIYTGSLKVTSKNWTDAYNDKNSGPYKELASTFQQAVSSHFHLILFVVFHRKLSCGYSLFYLIVCLFVYLYVCLCLSVCLPRPLSVCLCLSLFVCLSVHLSVCLSLRLLFLLLPSFFLMIVFQFSQNIFYFFFSSYFLFSLFQVQKLYSGDSGASAAFVSVYVTGFR